MPGLTFFKREFSGSTTGAELGTNRQETLHNFKKGLNLVYLAGRLSPRISSMVCGAVFSCLERMKLPK